MCSAQERVTDRTAEAEALVEQQRSYGQTYSSEQTGRRFWLTPFREVVLSTAADYAIKGLWPREGLVVAWGAPKSGKSFWAFDASMHLAMGWPYRGRRVTAGAVVYIAGEGQHGFRKRVQAFRQERDPEEDPPFYLLGEPVDLIGAHEQLIADIEAEDVAPALVVLDTLNRTLVGSESKDEDMGAYVKAADAIRNRFGCCVLVVHHCGIDGSRPRGHTSLTGAADAQFSVEKAADGRITVTGEYIKDGPEGDVIASTLRTVTVGTDEDGDPITSCIIEAADPPATDSASAQRSKLTSLQSTMLSVLEKAGPGGLTTKDWNQQARGAGVSAARQRLYEARNNLKRKKLVHQAQDDRWHVTTR